MADPILKVRRLSKVFEMRSGLPFRRRVRRVEALRQVDFDLSPGETLAIVGESGSGKSTLARTLMLLETPSAGTARFDGHDIFGLDAGRRQALRREMQMVFQDPWSSLNPRRTIFDTISEAWIVHPGLVDPGQFRQRVAEVLDTVGLDRAALDKYPNEFSGGQRQRIAIARALALNPSVLILDEAVSALDVSIQAQILNLLAQIQKEREIACLFISHDLAVVRHVADRVGVMYLGAFVELAPTGRIFDAPQHPYTRALLSAMPDDESSGPSQRIVLQGEIPDPSDPPSGCSFRTRCWRAQPPCTTTAPELREAGNDAHKVACHFPGEQETPQVGAGNHDGG